MPLGLSVWWLSGCRIEDSIDSLNDLHLGLRGHGGHTALAVQLGGFWGYHHVVQLSQTGAHLGVGLKLLAVLLLGQIKHRLGRLKDSLEALMATL